MAAGSSACFMKLSSRRRNRESYTAATEARRPQTLIRRDPSSAERQDDTRGSKSQAEVVDSAGLYEGTVAPQNAPHVILNDPRGRSDFLSVRRACSSKIVGCNSSPFSRYAPAVA